ncbi:MAG: redoxin domain-containing protein [Planctomycetes bacterium]|nr:redoxin domain-containing protein [Planctomycetota bacterium]MBU1518510.1 redoxin domain-containing protein [Planctomycetota bacterium]
MKKANIIVMWIAGVVFLVATALKIHQLLTEPIISKGFWESWEFFLIQIPLELGLGIWLVSGLFRKAGWLLALISFAGFIVVTLYKGIIGAESCGCFGTVHVDPWITLFIMDVPIFVLLAIFRPKGEKLLPPPWPKAAYFFAIAIPTFILLPTIEYVLITNKPPMVSEKYEVIDVSQWTNQEVWPLLQYTDIKDQLQSGEWVVLMYHNDCPDCREAMPEYEKMYKDIKGNNVDMAFIEMPPYEEGDLQLVPPNSQVNRGRVNDVKKWLVETPVVVVIDNGRVLKAWEGRAPELDELLNAAFGQ